MTLPVRRWFVALTVIGVCLLPAVPAVGQSAKLDATLADFVSDLGAYIDSVRFEQSDVDSFVVGWPEVSMIFEDEDEDDEAEDDSEEDLLESLRYSMTLVETAADNPEYRAWAASRGVDPDGWFRKSMRILMLGQRQAMMAQRLAVNVDTQIAQIEAQRNVYGDETADALIEATRMMNAVLDAFERIGEPTDSERSLLEANWSQLMLVMDSDEESWEEEDDWDGS